MVTNTVGGVEYAIKDIITHVRV